ncbi:capsule biosynthesis protein CapA [Planktomarina temperata]|nr:capsule biosynthesis protein CapA [Planktomarina temperata]MDC1193390.1 capsule biosynthesis protein CapA [Planktomarina temperata]MDC1233473.1 capsule biosynthesis protein CapA [Planktomarina temperata]
MADGFGRNFLLLQGPHGPFFRQLGQLLEQTGAAAWRVGFNGGDAFFWDNKARFIAHTESLETWPAALREIIAEKSITDLVLYGDTRPVHAEAIKLARALDLRVHVFEEGYLRPYWVNYERGGANGNSRLMGMTVAQMQKVLRKARIDLTEAPAHWGDIRQHAFYSFVYHLHILLNNRAYPNFKSHRADTVAQEFRTYVRRVLCHPIEILKRQITTRRIKNSGQAYHLVLMQLEHDSAFLMHSPFASMPEFLHCVVKAFAAGAPRHHRLVFKAHPLESGRRAVTVNSTAGQQALWRGLPVKAFGKAVYDKPQFVSDLPLEEFFAKPPYPDSAAYLDYRRYLLETSQIPGGFYSSRGRRQLLRQVIDMLLSDLDPFDSFEYGNSASLSGRTNKNNREVN